MCNYPWHPWIFKVFDVVLDMVLTLWLWWFMQVAPQINKHSPPWCWLWPWPYSYMLFLELTLVPVDTSDSKVSCFREVNQQEIIHLFWLWGLIFCIFFFPPPLANLPKPAHPGVRWLQGCEATHFSNTLQIESQPHGDASCWPNSNISVVSSIPVLIFLYPVS